MLKTKTFKENKFSLEIFKQIDKKNIYFEKKFGDINLISIFFLEIQKYLSCSFKVLLNNEKYKKEIKFPFFDKNYLERKIKLNFTKSGLNQNILDDDFKDTKLFYNFANKLSLYKKKDIGIYSSNKFVKNFISKKNIKSYRKLYFEKIFLNDYDEQSESLKGFLEKFKKKLKIKNIYFAKNFLRWTKIFISENLGSNILSTNKLYIGSNMQIKNRIMSARYLLNKKKVVSFAHANYSSLIYDDPVNECGEFCFCSSYHSNGKVPFKKKYIKSKLFKPKTVIYKSILRRNFISSPKKIKKVVYVPNSYNSYRRYGYFRDINDTNYIKWQKKIIDSSKNIYIKPHPKSRFTYNIFKKNKIKEKNIQNIINKFDLFIFDLISQPFFTIAETNKKILYLDINQRKIKKNIMDLIKKRALVVKCDLNKTSSVKIKEIINKAYNFKIKNFDILKH